MKTIGLLGGTSWISTITYYSQLNQMVHAQLGGFHSAKILLKSIDYHEIKNSYGKDDTRVAELLLNELSELISLRPDCVIICNNSLHKYYDLIKNRLSSQIPVMHAVELVTDYVKAHGYRKVLFLAAKFTTEDGFFTKNLEQSGVVVTIPDESERNQMEQIHKELIQNRVTVRSREYFSNLTVKYKDADAVIIGCTEYPMALDQSNSALPIIDSIVLQTKAAISYAIA